MFACCCCPGCVQYIYGAAGPGLSARLLVRLPGLSIFLTTLLSVRRVHTSFVSGSAMAVMDVGTRHVCATVGSTPKCWGEHHAGRRKSSAKRNSKNRKKINGIDAPLAPRVFGVFIFPLIHLLIEPFEVSPRVLAAPIISLLSRASPSAPSARSLPGVRQSHGTHVSLHRAPHIW